MTQNVTILENKGIPWNKGKKCPQIGRKGESHHFFGKHLSEEQRRKIGESFKGKPKSEEHKRKLSISKMGKLNPNYGKGAGVGEAHPNFKDYTQVGTRTLHQWVRRLLPAPKICPICNDRPVRDLINLTGIYNRDLTNWDYACRRCHMLSDGRMYNLRYAMNNKRLGAIQ
jgi:hypothetical protein